VLRTALQYRWQHLGNANYPYLEISLLHHGLDPEAQVS